MAKERITSLDALRAVVLFGILMVHTSVVFSFVNPTNIFEWSKIGGGCNFFIHNILQYRCNKIFGILFGVSFYLILKNLNYSPLKFVWRCVLLIVIGLINKLFYTVDALMWYGICGILLVLFRNLSNRNLFICFCCVFLLSSISSEKGFFSIESEISPFIRYKLPTSLCSVVSYPVLSAVTDYLIIISRDPLSCLWQFILGYYLAKKGIVENLQKYVSGKTVLFFGLLYIIFFFGRSLHLVFGVDGIITNSAWLFGALFYSLAFLFLYYKFYPKLRFLEAYGRLGLTNYSLQGVIGVILSVLIYIPYGWDIEYIYLASMGFFVIQLLFSNLWLKYFTNGPLEWLWRCLTNLKYSSPLIKTRSNV